MKSIVIKIINVPEDIVEDILEDLKSDIPTYFEDEVDDMTFEIEDEVDDMTFEIVGEPIKCFVCEEPHPAVDMTEFLIDDDPALYMCPGCKDIHWKEYS